MTNPTPDLTRDRLEEMEQSARYQQERNEPLKDILKLRCPLWPSEVLALIAMARRTPTVEQMELFDSLAEARHRKLLKQIAELRSRTEAVERERDRANEDARLANNGRASAIGEMNYRIARAASDYDSLLMSRDKAERERDALLAACDDADLDSVAVVLRDVIIGDSCDDDCGCVIHGLDRLRAALAASGGDA